MRWPVTKPASSEARKLTAWAMSAGVPIRGHRSQIGVPDLVGDVHVAFHRDETGGDRVHGDAERGELTSPAPGQADLRVLGGRVGGPARRRAVGDLGVDADDAAVPPGPHPGQHRAAEQHRALDEEVQLGDVVGPAHLGHRGLGLRAGGVQDQHVNWAERAGDRGDQAVYLVLVGDVGAEAPGGATVVADDPGHGRHPFVAGPAVDRDGKSVPSQAPRDRGAQAARASRHQGDPPARHGPAR